MAHLFRATLSKFAPALAKSAPVMTTKSAMFRPTTILRQETPLRQRYIDEFNPRLRNVYYAGADLDNLNNKYFVQKSVRLLAVALFCGGYSAYWYRQMYLHKFRVWDEMLWESAVVKERARKHYAEHGLPFEAE